MKTLLILLTFLLMAGLAIGQTQGVSVRSTNGFSYGTLTGQKIVATNFTGNGAGLTNLNAANLASGMVDGARLTGTGLTNAAISNSRVYGISTNDGMRVTNPGKINIGEIDGQSLLNMDTRTNTKAWQIRNNGTLYAHTVVEGTGGTGINGIGLFQQTYLAFQNTEASVIPQTILKQVNNGGDNYFNINAVTDGTNANKLYLYADGEIWLWPQHAGSVGVAATYQVEGPLAPLTDKRNAVTLGSSGNRWTNFFSTSITDDALKVTIATNLFVSSAITATNGVFGASGSIMLTTNVSVAMAANTYTNVGTYDYTTVFGNVTASADALTNGTAGRYFVAIHAAFAGAGAASLYEGAVFTNTVECTIIEWQRDVTTTFGSASASGIITLPSNCRIEYKIKNPDAETATFAKLGLTVMGAN